MNSQLTVPDREAVQPRKWSTSRLGHVEYMKTVGFFCKYIEVNSINMFPEIREVTPLREPTMTTTMTTLESVKIRLWGNESPLRRQTGLPDFRVGSSCM